MLSSQQLKRKILKTQNNMDSHTLSILGLLCFYLALIFWYRRSCKQHITTIEEIYKMSTDNWKEVIGRLEKENEELKKEVEILSQRK